MINQKALREILDSLPYEDISSVLRFGSSLYKDVPGDIDLCIVTKKDHFFLLIGKDPFKDKGVEIDITLVREEEISASKDFKFGSHGVHLIPAFKKAEILYGDNPFLKIPDPSVLEIKDSILDRLFDYHYEVRKLITSALTSRNIEIFEKRWGKFLRLALWLLDTKESCGFPAILQLSDELVYEKYTQLGIPTQQKFTSEGFEYIWEQLTIRNLY